MEEITQLEGEIGLCMLEQDYFEDIFIRQDIFPRGYGFNVFRDYKEMKRRARIFIEKEVNK